MVWMNRFSCARNSILIPSGTWSILLRSGCQLCVKNWISWEFDEILTYKLLNLGNTKCDDFVDEIEKSLLYEYFWMEYKGYPIKMHHQNYHNMSVIKPWFIEILIAFSDYNSQYILHVKEVLTQTCIRNLMTF